MVEQSPQNSFKRGKNHQWKFYREGGIFTENAVFFSLLLNSLTCAHPKYTGLSPSSLLRVSMLTPTTLQWRAGRARLLHPK